MPVGSAAEAGVRRRGAARLRLDRRRRRSRRTTHVLRRGDPGRPREEVGPGLPAVLVPREPEPPVRRRRTATRPAPVAGALARVADNPLTARVMVNRVWQWHFGRGLVPTASDFGTAGEPPTHPELLDWLAARVRRRRLAPEAAAPADSSCPATYQQSARRAGGRCARDPEDAPALALAAAPAGGRGGPRLGAGGQRPAEPAAARAERVPDAAARAVLEGQSRPGDGWGKSDERQQARRSVYVFVKRSLAVPELDLLDAPDTTTSCAARPVSTTAPQALTFFNGAFVNEQAAHFAERLRREAGDDPAAQVRRAFELALCRPPRHEEQAAGVAFLGRQPLEAFCLVVLNLNEFVYLQ